jgi:hypothetical protein
MPEEINIEERIIVGECGVSTATAVWVAAALLHKENPSRNAFRINEIGQKVNDLKLLTVQPATIHQHITSHCVANSHSSPDTNRMLFRVQRGLYRLYRKSDQCHETREYGKITPMQEVIPEQYRNLLEWYENEYATKASSTFQEIIKDTVNPPFARIEDNYIVRLPKEVREKLGLGVGDHIAFVENITGQMLIRKARLSIMV